MLVANKYKIIGKIGSGSYGNIYKAVNTRTAEYVAVKEEDETKHYQMLKNESKILQYLKNIEGVPELKWYSVMNGKSYMVTTLLGGSLMDLLEKKRVFLMKWIRYFGSKIILILEKVHDVGIVHRDIKPDNFLFETDAEKKENLNLFLIDYGLAKCYTMGTVNHHIPMKKTSGIIGTLNYVSLHGHDLHEPSRRDDLESFMYMMVLFYYGELEWARLTDPNDISHAKLELRSKVGLPTQFKQMFEYIDHLCYDERPNYKHLKEMLLNE